MSHQTHSMRITVTKETFKVVRWAKGYDWMELELMGKNRERFLFPFALTITMTY